MLAILFFCAIWTRFQALPISPKHQVRPLGPVRGYAEVRSWPTPKRVPAGIDALSAGRRQQPIVARRNQRDFRVKGLSGSEEAYPQETPGNATKFSAANKFIIAWATVLKYVSGTGRLFLNRIKPLAQRANGLSRIINIIIVFGGLFGAIWNWFTATPQFVSVFQNLLNSRSFMRLEAAWIALPAQNWVAFESYIHNQPWTSAAVITGVAYALADWTAQSCEGRGPFGFSRARLFRNMIVGAGILGPYAHQYYEIQDRIITGKGLIWAPLKVFVDQTIYACSYNCLFLAGLGVLQRTRFKDILDDIRTKIPVMMKGSWRFWPFVHLFTYTVIPTHFKLLWVDAMDVIWVTYLSTIANARRAETTKVVQELVEQQADGKFLEAWLAGKALKTLAERAAEIQKMETPDSLPPESERVSVTDEPRRNLTVVQIAEGDRTGLMLDIAICLRRQSVSIVHGIIDSTDAKLSANVFFVVEEATKLPLSKERREQLRDVLEYQLYKSKWKYPKEVTEAIGAAETLPPPRAAETQSVTVVEEPEAKAAEPEKPTEKPEKPFRPPPHAATELLYAIEVDKETRIEVGLALEQQGLQVPETWWEAIEEDREWREEQKQKEEEAEREEEKARAEKEEKARAEKEEKEDETTNEEKKNEEAEREEEKARAEKEEKEDETTNEEKKKEDKTTQEEAPEPMAELSDGVDISEKVDEEALDKEKEEKIGLKEKIGEAIEDAIDDIEDAIEMDVKESNVGDSLANILEEAVNDADIEEVANKEEDPSDETPQAEASTEAVPGESSAGGVEPPLAAIVQDVAHDAEPPAKELAEAAAPVRPGPSDEPSRLLLDKATPYVASLLFAAAVSGAFLVIVALAVFRYRVSMPNEIKLPLMAMCV